MNEDRPEVFRGHFDECFKHLGTSLAARARKGSREAALQKKPVADFCGVTVNSVTRWLHSTGPLPIGEHYIRLMCYLDMVGYRVIELERMPKGRRNFAELVGFGLLSSEQAIELLGYSYPSTLYQVLQGHHGASENKDQKMWDAWKERKEELERKKKQLQEQYSLDVPRDVPLKVHQKAEGAKPATLTSGRTAVINIMEGLLALLEEESFEKLSAGGFKELQQSADTILRLSAHLSTLSSRLIMSEQRKGGS